ncbi:unnamed protein product [Phytophthora fragariaefolia]|uniref:Unnamed protein product n=1 Tax=Phytophthora fragariaefolia TaxID=1490495 RepID=A0A9W6XRX4_9STRA|nr:unnamed protein product [Phytophthora fragariaefolia]
MYVPIKNNVLAVDRGVPKEMAGGLKDVVMSAINVSAAQRATTQSGTFLYFHRRFGDLSYDDIERLARDPANRIELTDHTRQNFLTCAEGKQSKSAHPQQDSGRNPPIDVVGGVIRSDLMETITPMYRRKNRYIVNLVDHKSNYCRVFASKTRDEAAKKFQQFMAFFERRFNVRGHMLRTDGGGEYRNLDLFCQQTGVARQVTEANTSASNGKAKRMHRTVTNMVRCMLFGCGLPLSY